MALKAINDFSKGLSLYKIWTYEAWHELSAKYKRTALGSIWLSAPMVTMSLCLSLVFGALLGADVASLLPHIMGGILCFSLVSFIFDTGPEIYMSYQNIIKNHAYPFSYYTFETICRVFFTFLNNLIVFWISMAIIGKLTLPNVTIFLGLLVVMTNMFFWGSLIALLSARYRDLRFMMPQFAMAIFYVTPIMWRVEDVSPKAANIVYKSPFYGLLEIVRAPLLGKIAPVQCWTSALISVAVGMLLWLIFFGKFRRRIAFWV